MDPFKRLEQKDIIEKIEKNKKDWGHSLSKLRELLIIQRQDLNRKRLMIDTQIQNLTEQIEYIDFEIEQKKEDKING